MPLHCFWHTSVSGKRSCDRLRKQALIGWQKFIIRWNRKSVVHHHTQPDMLPRISLSPVVSVQRWERLQGEKVQLEQSFERELKRLQEEQQKELKALQERLLEEHSAEIQRLRQEQRSHLELLRTQHQEQVRPSGRLMRLLATLLENGKMWLISALVTTECMVWRIGEIFSRWYFKFV